MATYAIGDVQGCFDSLKKLLSLIEFQPKSDELWFVGDLVNRGPKSREVLEYIMALGDRATVVLGNHDLHLLYRAAGFASARRLDTLDAVLEAPNAVAMINWLRSRPVMVRRDPYVMVHAGLHPTWTVEVAEGFARRIEATLRAPGWQDGAALLKRERTTFGPDLSTSAQRAAALAVLSRVRMCRADGAPYEDYAGEPEAAPAGLRPWFALPNCKWRTHTILFGHWAALGYREGPHYVGLDSGCVWGRQLTAYRLEDGVRFAVQAAEPPRAFVEDEEKPKKRR